MHPRLSFDLFFGSLTINHWPHIRWTSLSLSLSDSFTLGCVFWSGQRRTDGPWVHFRAQTSQPSETGGCLTWERDRWWWRVSKTTKMSQRLWRETVNNQRHEQQYQLPCCSISDGQCLFHTCPLLSPLSLCLSLSLSSPLPDGWNNNNNNMALGGGISTLEGRLWTAWERVLRRAARGSSEKGDAGKRKKNTYK